MFEYMRSLLGIFLVFLILISSCRKNEGISTDPNSKLSFAKDSLYFDTIFTTVGSVTKKLKIYNRNDDALNISSIVLSGGPASSFSLNINGENILSKSNVILNGNDSLNLFIKVTINPTVQNLPFLIQDSITFLTNGNRQSIPLLAYGQNAVFINNGIIDGKVSWTNKLPYLINNTLTIKSGSTLNVAPGAKIYFHKDAMMNVEGNLIAVGTDAAPIQFCSDRLETIYSNQPGQWKGIYLKKTGSGLIQYSVIKNASVGITSDSLSTNANPKLILSNNVIKNMQVAAYIGYHSDLTAFNNLWYNCGNYLIYAIGGGSYNLKQNTFVGYNIEFPRKTAALTFSDYLSAKSYNNLQLDLINNIIWGNLVNELDIQNKTTAIIQRNISNNLIKTTNTNYNNSNIINIDPQFVATEMENFKLSINSVALKKGLNLNGDKDFNAYLNKDLENKIRISPSTLGCYEHQ